MNECSRCGTELPAGTTDDGCQKCLLQIGLASGTDFSIGELAETLPHRNLSDSAPTNANLGAGTRGQSGLSSYQQLQAVHDWSGGTVYRAFHEGLQRFVMLRVLESSADDDARRSFLTRAEKLSHLNHPNLPATLEAGIDHGEAFVAEECIDGQPIGGFLPRTRRERWAEGFYPNADLMRVMRDVAAALSAIHGAGLTHDRINPDAVLVDSGGMVRLVGLGESAEATDDRFARPKQSGGESPEERSVSADLYRFAATFCFLTTGKLPQEIDPELNQHSLSRGLKNFNPGLRTDVCQLIWRCLSGLSAVDTGHPHRNRSTENPYEATDQNNSTGYHSANDLVDELNRALQHGIHRVSWRLRFFSAYLEAFCCLLICGLTYSFLAKRFQTDWTENAIGLTTSVFVLPILYFIGMETVFGWTIVRRLFGMQLFDHAEERARWWRRLSRSAQKAVLLVCLLALPAMASPLLAGTGISPVLAMVILPIGQLFLPMLGMYLPSRWIPSRWTSYDLTAGVSWAESAYDPMTRSIESVEAKSNEGAGSLTGKVDQYELYGSLGSGGMGQVYRGRDCVLGRDVAIKLLSGSLIENPLLLERFQREARLAAKVNHPGVAKVFDNGVWNQTPYIAMELVRGSNLQQRIKECGALPIATAWDFVTQAVIALRAADRSGVVHRDVKPANLMITDDGKLKVTDFGVSRSVTIDSNKLTMTESGTIVGTPAYMAPEQAMGKEVDCRSDIYALGMTLYHMLSGHAPFKANNAVEMLAQQMTETPPSLIGKVAGMTQDHADVLDRMIAKQPAERYSGYDELLADLNRCAPGVNRLAHPVKRIAAELCHWAAGYLFFTLIIFVSFFLRLQGAFNSYDGTTLFGYFMLLLFIGFCGAYIIGIAFSGATPGKQILGLRVVRENGKRVGLWRAFLRFAVAYPLFVLYVPRICYYIIARAPGWPFEQTLYGGLLVIQIVATLVSIVMMWRRADRQTLHDLAAGTTVICDQR